METQENQGQFSPAVSRRGRSADSFARCVRLSSVCLIKPSSNKVTYITTTNSTDFTHFTNAIMLYLIPTPIGNLEDITLRALHLLRELPVLICEDTRTTKSLLHKLEIDYSDKQFVSLTSFTGQGKLDHYVDLIKANEVGLVSDAGTP